MLARCRNMDSTIASPSATSAAATVMMNIVKTCPVSRNCTALVRASLRVLRDANGYDVARHGDRADVDRVEHQLERH